MSNRYALSYMAGGLMPAWTKTIEFESDEAAIQAARILTKAEADATTARPITMLVGRCSSDEDVIMLGAWSWSAAEGWMPS